MKAILITGDRSGSGKTSITLALSALLARENAVQSFKVGMDYIDPSYLTAASGRPCRNLDSYVMDKRTIRAVFSHGCRDAEIALVEGVRGLYEGAEAIGDTGSTASIAKALDLPVILVVSARSITRSAAAIVAGFKQFDPEVRISGVILNNVKGDSHKKKAVSAIEHYCGLPVIGAVPRIEEMGLAMRHLGLIPFLEGQRTREFTERIDSITRVIGEYVDLGMFKSLMRSCPYTKKADTIFKKKDADIRIAVALDEAFNFYYADLFDLLPALGASVVPFSPIHDQLPDADGYIIGGGYPEMFLSELEANEKMRSAVSEASRDGRPIYAECGGLMYLTDRIRISRDLAGNAVDRSAEMCGVFSGETHMPARRVVSYVEGKSSNDSLLGSAGFRGHEFHYSKVVLDKDTRYSYRLSRGIGIKDNLDGATIKNTLGSYTHLHPVPARQMFGKFVERCRAAR
ncbi:MAG: cobyrinic acid a,c-diamide synthase [Methanoregula sp. PtaU1.Bin051]|nr:MAG: cobyrinic acid a,c-diamide synthase [Methanoregula sp. PtaU1.Bin051]